MDKKMDKEGRFLRNQPENHIHKREKLAEQNVKFMQAAAAHIEDLPQEKKYVLEDTLQPKNESSEFLSKMEKEKPDEDLVNKIKAGLIVCQEETNAFGKNVNKTSQELESWLQNKNQTVQQKPVQINNKQFVEKNVLKTQNSEEIENDIEKVEEQQQEQQIFKNNEPNSNETCSETKDVLEDNASQLPPENEAEDEDRKLSQPWSEEAAAACVHKEPQTEAKASSEDASQQSPENQAENEVQTSSVDKGSQEPLSEEAAAHVEEPPQTEGKPSLEVASQQSPENQAEAEDEVQSLSVDLKEPPQTEGKPSSEDASQQSPVNEAKTEASQLVSNDSLEEKATPSSLEETQIDESLQKIQAIQEETKKLDGEVTAFTGTKGDKEFLHLDELLIRTMIKLDNVDSCGNAGIRKNRKDALQYVQEVSKKLNSVDAEDASLIGGEGIN